MPSPRHWLQQNLHRYNTATDILDEARKHFPGSTREGLRSILRRLRAKVTDAPRGRSYVVPTAEASPQSATENLPRPTAPPLGAVVPAEAFLAGVNAMGVLLGFLAEHVGDDYIADADLQTALGWPTRLWDTISRLPEVDEYRFAYHDYRCGNARRVVWSSKSGVQRARLNISMGQQTR